MIFRHAAQPYLTIGQSVAYPCHAPLKQIAVDREFKDVVFEDVVFDHNGCYLIIILLCIKLLLYKPYNNYHY